MYSMVNVDNNIVLLLCNVVSIATLATLQYINVSKYHTVHLKLTQRYMSNLFKK